MGYDLLADLTDTADALTQPYQIRTPRWTWDHNRHRKPLRDHVIVQPGLLTQLGDMAYPGSPPDNGGTPTRPVPSSRPPGNIAAMSAYLAIMCAVTRWTLSLRLELRDTIESSVRQLLARIVVEDSDTQTALLSEMRSWQYQCEVITGWRDPDPQVQAPCPHCGDRQLRINLADRVARCGGCQARWVEDPDEYTGSIGVLARHIADHREQSKAAADEARQAERTRKERRNGRSVAA